MSNRIPRRSFLALSAALAGAAGLTACGAKGSAASSDTSKLTFGGWSLDSTPEFKLLADAFHKKNPATAVTLKEYSADNYDTQLTSDLSAKSAPDAFPIKNLTKYYYYESNGQLRDLSDTAKKLADDKNIELKYVEVDGNCFTLPYRQDSWFLYYNKDLFAAAKVAAPDGSWTWQEYAEAAKKLTKALAGTKTPAKGTYTHTWQSVVQSFALVQTKGASLTSGDLGFLKKYYDLALEIQDAGAAETFATAQSQSLTYQAQFGTQKAAMMPMGSWYIATLLQQQQSGDADKFEWGIAPAPQFDSSTVKNPVTYGNPTGVAVNPGLKGAKADLAVKFADYLVSEDASKLLATIGVTGAYNSSAVQQAMFRLKGMPQDDLSKFTYSTHDTRPETPVGPTISDIEDLLKDTHSVIMTKSTTVDQGIAKAEAALKSQSLTQ